MTRARRGDGARLAPEYRVVVVLRARSRKAAERWFDAALVPMRDEDGTAVAFVTGASRALAREFEAVREAAFRAGWGDGFDASGEGWNGEYPFRDGRATPAQLTRIKEQEDNAVAEYLRSGLDAKEGKR
jgi:hypothetical protein